MRYFTSIFLIFSFFAFLISSALAKVPAKVDVVIIGAGLSGLATAYQLKKAGVSYHVLELTPRVGGRVRTVEYKRAGVTTVYADSGMEEYWESNPAVALLKELNLPVRHDYAASSMILGGRLEILDDGEDTTAFQKKIFSKREFQLFLAFKKKAEAVLAEIRSGNALSAETLHLKDVAFSKWVAAQHVPQRVMDWVRISLECEIGTQWTQISALDGIAEFHIFAGKGEESYRVNGGNQRFTEALADAVDKKNISLNKRVGRIVTRGNQVSVSYLDQETNESGVVLASQVVSTIPLFRLFEVQFEPPLSERKRMAITSQSYGAYFKAHIFVPESAKKFWTKGAHSVLPILSDSELGVIYEGNPDQDIKTKVISLLIYGHQADAFNMLPLDNVRTAIKGAFDRIWPGFSKEIEAIEFYRFHPRAIAAWPVGRSRFDALSQEIRKPENHIYFGGDFTETSHSDGAFISAERVVRQILEARRKGS